MTSNMKHSDKKWQIVNELHKPARINFKRRKVVVKGLSDLMQIDLADMSQYSGDNNGYKFILIAIDAFSKRAYAEPLKNKSGPEVTTAMQNILNESGSFKLILSDRGTEFYNKHFQELMKKHDIKHYSTFSETKAQMAERLIRTLKGNLFKIFSYRGSHKWVDVLAKVVKKYNETPHRTIKMKPISVNKKNEQQLLRGVYRDNPRVKQNNKLDMDDHVRISKHRYVFQKSYQPLWSYEVFKIRRVQNTNPVTYLLEDLQGAPISGSFYSHEVSKTKLIHDYLVEKVLKRQGSQVLVRWLGFDKSHDSWIDANNML